MYQLVATQNGVSKVLATGSNMEMFQRKNELAWNWSTEQRQMNLFVLPVKKETKKVGFFKKLLGGLK